MKKVKFAARCRYYERKFSFFQNNSKKTWHLINEVTSRKKRNKNIIKSLTMPDGNTTRDPKLMADTLNNFFVNIGTNMSNQLPPSDLSPDHFLNKHSRPQRNSFFLSPTCPADVAKIIDGVFRQQSCRTRRHLCKFF